MFIHGIAKDEEYIFQNVFFDKYTLSLCIGEGKVRVACSMLYPIFKFWEI